MDGSMVTCPRLPCSPASHGAAATSTTRSTSLPTAVTVAAAEAGRQALLINRHINQHNPCWATRQLAHLARHLAAAKGCLHLCKVIIHVAALKLPELGLHIRGRHQLRKAVQESAAAGA